MKQRLGIAHALLGDPEVLILDEPANGLDPAGIRWMRDLLKGYADRGGTVLLSSHLLNEVELVADEMILIGRGRIVAQGDKQTLLAEPATDGSAASSPRADDAALADALRRAGLAPPPPTAGPSRVDVEHRRRRPASPLEHRVVLTELRNGAAGLEDLFLELTSDTQRDAVARPPPPDQGAAA